MTPAETVLAFFAAINSHNSDKLAELMTEDHVFIDALGNSVLGREKTRAAWRGYFVMCPDYLVSHEDVLHNGNTVAVFGSAAGTISVNGELRAENRWRIPAAWRLMVYDGLVREFRVYADNKPVYGILAKAVKTAVR
jgi:ketosteroid isomerase-like protein